ncbi:MauE/DoxX family redox-associated membrane protein [Chitinophaga vietnamensis]|uniref:MauE/DoxX family redox-associated membrane protein n=1 Tax=Chitinophaga vietnamensis TaxID=2593957 RepID=UPI001178B689|nr:MauE/DoxX family redox-associated membrane protein [Chitinophaga vietnamensis]
MKKYYAKGIAVLIALFFVYACFSRWFEWEIYQHDMYAQPVPKLLSSVLIWVLPPAGLIIAFFLTNDRFRKSALLAAAGLLFLYAAYAAAILLHLFPRTPCSCSGIIKLESWPKQLLLSGGGCVAALVGYFIERKKEFIIHP